MSFKAYLIQFTALLLLFLESVTPAEAGAVSPNGQWEIEIIELTPSHTKMILHDLLTKKDQLALDGQDYWNPAPEDAAKVIWRPDSRAFALADYARKFTGYSIWVLWKWCAQAT